MRKKKSNSKRLAKAKAEHVEFLARHGIDGNKRPRLKGVEAAAAGPAKNSTPLSDKIPASGSRARRYVVTSDQIVQQAYNKGPIMVIGRAENPNEGKRRDR